MTQGLELGAGGAGELVRREHARGLGADVVVAIFRLVKLTQMHDLANQAMQRQLEELEKLIRQYCLQAGSDVNILFARRAVFLAGQLLRASRGEYESANELGETLERLGGSELTIARDVTADDLRAFAEAVSAALRGGTFRSPTPRIRLRPVNDAARVRGLEVETLELEQRVVRTYASAVVVMRRFFERLAAGDYAPPKRLKRIAQSLVDLSTGSTMAFLRVTEARNANFDEAGRAVNTAILAVAAAREVTEERTVLAHIAMASMLLDAGRPRASASVSGGPQLSSVAAQLTEEQEDALPGGTAAVLTALGRLNEATVRRTVVAYEALWMRRVRSLGPLYGGLRPVTLHARLVALCRRYCDLLTPEPGLPPPTPDQAIATLHGELRDGADKTVLRMLVSALGLLPVGTVVRLTSGEVGEVVAAGAHGVARDRPCVRIAMDAGGSVLDQPTEIDLSAPGVDPGRRIASVVSVDGWSKAVAARAPAISWSEHPSRETGVSAVRPVGERASADTESKPDSVHFPVSLRPATPAAPAVDASDRTVVQRSPFEDVEAPTSTPLPSTRSVVIRTRDPVGEPMARGRLEATPLVQVLVYVLDHQLSGTLELREPDGVESTVVFTKGAPVKVRSGRPVARLGEILSELGVVTREQVAEAVVASHRAGMLLGEQLVARELVDRETLEGALAGQVIHKLVALVHAPPETQYAFYRDANALDQWPTAQTFPVHPLDAIFACTRAWRDRARIHATLARIAQVKLVFSVAAELDAVGFTGSERAVVDQIRRSEPTLVALQEERGAEDETLATLVYVLAVTRQFAFLVKKGLPMGREHGEPRPVSDPDEGRISRVSWLPDDSKGPPSSLQVSVSPEPPVVVTMPPAPASVQPPIPSRPPPLPKRVRKTETPPADDDPKAERRLQSMADLRLAETAMQRGDTEDAARLATKAALGDPENRDAESLVAWLHSLGGKPQFVAEALAELSRLLEDDPKHERSRLYRGRLYARSGRVREAIEDLEAVASANPMNTEAASELHLLRTKKK